MPRKPWPPDGCDARCAGAAALRAPAPCEAPAEGDPAAGAPRCACACGARWPCPCPPRGPWACEGWPGPLLLPPEPCPGRPPWPWPGRCPPRPPRPPGGIAGRLDSPSPSSYCWPRAPRPMGIGTGLTLRSGSKPGTSSLGNLALQHALDVAQQPVLVHADQRERLAGRTGAAGAADAVHVVLGDVGQLEVHHVRQVVDVQAAGGDVGGHQHLQAAVLELGQRPGARALALVAVDGQRADAVLVELLGEPVGAVLGAGEDQHLVPVVVLDQLGQQRRACCSCRPG